MFFAFYSDRSARSRIKRQKATIIDNFLEVFALSYYNGTVAETSLLFPAFIALSWCNDMYLGSVRFFKHVIIGTLTLIVFLITFLLFTILQQTVFAHAYQISDASVRLPAAAPDTQSAAEPAAGVKESAQPLAVAAPPEKTAPPEVSRPPETMPAQAPSAQVFDESKPYQRLYPELYCAAPDIAAAEKGRVYLTFDDGPSRMTDDILDILRDNGIKATFFLSGTADAQELKSIRRIADEGHSIGIHTYTHEYGQVYRSVEAYLEDFNAMFTLISRETGISADIFRFPGGSINDYDRKLYPALVEEMTRRGFTYFDWNVDAKDSYTGATVKSITRRVLDEIPQHSRSIVLFHDGISKCTVSALGHIIESLKEDGYLFEKLTSEVKPIVFSPKK